MQKLVNDVIDIFTSEDMENMSLVVFRSKYKKLGVLQLRKVKANIGVLAVRQRET